MTWLTRSFGSLTVALGLVVLGIFAPHAPSASPGSPRALTLGMQQRLPADWSARILDHLEEKRLPMSRAALARLLGTVKRSASRFGVDPLAVLAVIEVESQYDPRAVSDQGAIGLMQLRTETARELAPRLGIDWTSDDLLFDPETNVILGTFYLRCLLDRFGDLDHALAAYAIGPTRIAARRAQTGPLPLRYANRVWDALLALQSRAAA